MNILHVYKTYITDSTGGVEQVMRQICLTTAQQGMNNRVLCLSHSPEPNTIQTEEAEVFRYPINFEISSTPFSWQALRAFKALASWADIIHYQFPWPFADLLHSMIRPQKPSVVTYQSDVVRQKIGLFFYRPLQHYFLKSVTSIVATSPQYSQTSSVLQKFGHKTKVIPIGLDKSTYPSPSKERLEYWQKQLGKGFFLFVGVMRYYKGVHILLEACQNMRCKVVLAGTGPMEASLKEQAARLQLNNVHFLGKIADEDKIALLQLSLAVVFASHLRSEAFGVSLLEGAMYGKPLISAEIGTGTSYINIHQQTGLVVPPADPSALAQAMQFLHNNPSEAERMGQCAEKRYWEYFTAKAMGDSYIRLYQSCLGS